MEEKTETIYTKMQQQLFLGDFLVVTAVEGRQGCAAVHECQCRSWTSWASPLLSHLLA